MKERAGLQAKVERYETVLKQVLPYLSAPGTNGNHWVPVITEALSAGEGEKEEQCTMCKEKPKGEGLLVCDDCYKAFDGDRRGFWASDSYQ